MPLSFCTRIKGRIVKMWLIMHSARFTSSHNLQGVVSYLNSSRSQWKASICQSILNESCGVGGFIITERNLIQPLFHINLNDHRHMFLIKLDNWTLCPLSTTKGLSNDCYVAHTLEWASMKSTPPFFLSQKKPFSFVCSCHCSSLFIFLEYVVTSAAFIFILR